MPASPSPLRRLDAEVLPRVRRRLVGLASTAAAPLRTATRWEAAPGRPAAVRSVVARPGLVALAAALVVFIASAAHLQRFESSVGSGAGADQVVTPETQDGIGEVGPRVGSDLEAYADGRREALAELEGDLEVRAVVSFTSYLGAEELELPDQLEVEQLLVRVQVLDEDPREVEVDGQDPAHLLEAAVEEEHDRLLEEEEELASLLDSDIEDAEFVEEFERRLEEVREVRGELDDDAQLLYAVVVVGTVEVLEQVQASEGVRLVDPGGELAETRRTRFFGLLPEDDDRASHGRSL